MSIGDALLTFVSVFVAALVAFYLETALDIWLADEGLEPNWADVDSINVNTAVSFTPLLLSAGVSAVPNELLGQMFVADATAPALLRRSEGVTRLFEAHVLTLVLGCVLELTPEQRRAVARHRAEFLGLRDHMSGYLDRLDGVREELTRLDV